MVSLQENTLLETSLENKSAETTNMNIETNKVQTITKIENQILDKHDTEQIDDQKQIISLIQHDNSMENKHMNLQDTQQNEQNEYNKIIRNLEFVLEQRDKEITTQINESVQYGISKLLTYNEKLQTKLEELTLKVQQNDQLVYMLKNHIMENPQSNINHASCEQQTYDNNLMFNDQENKRTKILNNKKFGQNRASELQHEFCHQHEQQGEYPLNNQFYKSTNQQPLCTDYGCVKQPALQHNLITDLKKLIVKYSNQEL